MVLQAQVGKLNHSLTDSSQLQVLPDLTTDLQSSEAEQRAAPSLIPQQHAVDLAENGPSAQPPESKLTAMSYPSFAPDP